MHRTVTALYDTQAKAERVRDALKAANLGDHVEIHDQSAAADSGGAHHGDFGAWLGHLFGGHHDQHVYREGVVRGHFLLAAKVDDLNETRAAEIMDAAEPVDLAGAQQAWRAEGWTPPPAVIAQPAVDPAAAAPVVDPTAAGAVRVYPVNP